MKDKMKCAETIAKWIGEHGLNEDTKLYVNDIRYDITDEGELKYDLDADPKDYITGAGDIISMSFEGPLYDVVNYAWSNELYSKVEKKFSDMLKGLGLYYELCDAWCCTLAEC